MSGIDTLSDAVLRTVMPGSKVVTARTFIRADHNA